MESKLALRPRVPSSYGADMWTQEKRSSEFIGCVKEQRAALATYMSISGGVSLVAASTLRGAGEGKMRWQIQHKVFDIE